MAEILPPALAPSLIRRAYEIDFGCKRLYSSSLRTPRSPPWRWEQASEIEKVDAKERLDIGVALSSVLFADISILHLMDKNKYRLVELMHDICSRSRGSVRLFISILDADELIREVHVW